MTKLARLRALASNGWDDATISEVREIIGAAPALVEIAEAVGRLSMYEDHELTSEEFEERLGFVVDAYRRLLESCP